jgi:hypothetical protein
MDERLARTSLIIFIIAIFFFIGTFGWFMLFKEHACAVNLNSASCFESYPTFLHNELNRI